MEDYTNIWIFYPKMALPNHELIAEDLGVDVAGDGTIGAK